MASYACSSYQPISKATLKALSNRNKDLGPQKPCTKPCIMKKKSLIDKLADNDWEITSFDPKSRVVCFNFANRVGLYHGSLTLPDLTGKSWS